MSDSSIVRCLDNITMKQIHFLGKLLNNPLLVQKHMYITNSLYNGGKLSEIFNSQNLCLHRKIK